MRWHQPLERQNSYCSKQDVESKYCTIGQQRWHKLLVSIHLSLGACPSRTVKTFTFFLLRFVRAPGLFMYSSPLWTISAGYTLSALKSEPLTPEAGGYSLKISTWTTPFLLLSNICHLVSLLMCGFFPFLANWEANSVRFDTIVLKRSNFWVHVNRDGWWPHQQISHTWQPLKSVSKEIDTPV